MISFSKIAKKAFSFYPADSFWRSPRYGADDLIVFMSAQSTY
jgi:hypothetical protein